MLFFLIGSSDVVKIMQKPLLKLWGANNPIIPPQHGLNHLFQVEGRLKYDQPTYQGSLPPLFIPKEHHHWNTNKFQTLRPMAERSHAPWRIVSGGL